MYGTDAGKLKQVIAQANYDGATGTSNIDVVNDGTIDYSKKGATAIVVDYGQATNNGLIKMDAANGSTENSIGLFGASSSKLTNSATGEIQLGTRGVGIWGAHKIDTSVSTWSKNIDITNNGKITGISGKKGVFGIYAVNDIATYAGATSNIVHGATGNIDLSQNEDSIGIYMANGTLTSSGNILVNNKSVGLDATTSDVTVSGGTHTIGKESVGFKLKNFAATNKFLGNSGNISITDEKSVAYLLDGSNFTSNTNFKDNLALASTKAYTYMSLINNSTLNYTNTKTIANDDSIFINTNNSTVNLLTGTTVTSTNKKVTGVYSEKLNVTNAGTLTLTGDYAKSGSVVNQATGKITVGKDGSGIYVMATGTPPVPATGTNLGEIEIGQGSVGMCAENSTITNGATGKITSSGISATGMSQSVGSQDITNNGTITLTGDKSTALHSEGITTANHKVINTGDITVGDSSNELTPSVGIYSANGTNSTVESSGNVGQIGIAMRKGAILTNNGTIHIDATKGYGLFLAGAIVKNYGTANITTGSGATPIKEVTAADTSKEMQDIQDGINKVKIHSPAGAAEAKIIANGRVQTPTVVHVQAIPNRKPNDIPTSSIGMYVDTSGINYTRPITNIGALRGLTQSDLIIGVEATKYTTSKYIQLGQDIIEPYNDMIRTSGIEKWNIYSSSLTWMASIT